MSAELPGSTNRKYLFDSGSDLGSAQLGYLEALLDAPTVRSLQAAGVRPGDRCLDLGAGGGSITRWLAERTGPSGSVFAVDLETGPLLDLAGRPGIEVQGHDINEGLPEEGPYDLIHARLLLLHLPRREEILAQLVEALAPGGRLVLGEVSDRPNGVLAAPGEGDAELFARVQEIAHHVVSPARGVSWTWAHEVHRHMAEAGLAQIHSAVHSETAAGGSTGCLLHRNYALQAQPLLLRAGLSEAELKRYGELLLHPGFRVWFYEFVCTRAQKP